MQTENDTTKPETEPKQKTGEGCPGATCSTFSASIDEVSISEHPNFHEIRNDWGVIPAHFETVEWDEWSEPVRREWVPENRAGYRPELDGKSLAYMWDAEKQDWAIQPPGLEGITSFLRPKASCSVIRVRYRVDVQSVSGRWDNVEIRDDEATARRAEDEWRSWLNENRKTWKDIRIVKETTIAEVLQNDQALTPARQAQDGSAASGSGPF